MNMDIMFQKQKKEEIDIMKTGSSSEESNDNNDDNKKESKYYEAILYLDQVKIEFKEQPHIYNEFLDILNSTELDIPSVIRRVSYLFRGYNTKLLLGFNTFLPNDYKIKIKHDNDDDDNDNEIENDDDDEDCDDEEDGVLVGDEETATTAVVSGLMNMKDYHNHQNCNKKLKYYDDPSSDDDHHVLSPPSNNNMMMMNDNIDDDGLVQPPPPNKRRRRSSSQRRSSKKSSPRSSMNILASTASVAASGGKLINNQQIQILKAIDSGMFDRLAALGCSAEATGEEEDDHHHIQQTAAVTAVKPEPITKAAAQVSEDSNMSSPSITSHTKSPSPKMKAATTTKKRKQKDPNAKPTPAGSKKQPQQSRTSSNNNNTTSCSRGRGKPRRVIPEIKNFIDGEPRDVDVVSGRGGRSNNHPGNQTHWLVMLKHRQTYNNCGQDDALKNRIAQQVVDYIEKSQGGRYVQRCKETNRWFILPNKVALEKVKQGLRDKHVPDWVGKKMKKDQEKRDKYGPDWVGKKMKKDNKAQPGDIPLPPIPPPPSSLSQQQQQQQLIRHQQLIRQQHHQQHFKT